VKSSSLPFPARARPAIALTFDVEEHDRIEAAAHLDFDPALRAVYSQRMQDTTHWLLDVLGERSIRATFFVVGQIARSHPGLIRRMVEGGHEVASHSWMHRRVSHFTPRSFRDDVRLSKDALEQAGGAGVAGFRAPTFSITRDTLWAVDVLAELGLRYDSSVFPVHHDRYGIPDAPRTPFRIRGQQLELLELPLLTWRLARQNLPVAGGGYFRLFPLAFMERGIKQITSLPQSAAVLYFHPWEFDAGQPRLPLSRLSRFRTYVGIRRSRARLERLLSRHTFVRMIDLAAALERPRIPLPCYPGPIPMREAA
jgi:polysaccharide deacetylase family protein (PEP-CTERM system associated)